jgi:cell volume regulation protein A
MIPIENILLWVGLLIFVSVISSKISDKFAIPVLLIFLLIGMIAGSEGIGGLYFNDPNLAKSVGIVALIFIIFSGGLDTEWSVIKPVMLPGIILSTAGVLLTAAIAGVFAVYILKFSLLEGMLLGSIVSSTDAPSVFNILRSKRISLKKPVKSLLEFESGSNDPMALFLTASFISLLTVPDTNAVSMLPLFILDMGVGGLVGYLMGKAMLLIIKHLKLESQGLYPVITISFVLLTYALAVHLHGNGILAVYLAGLIMGQVKFPNKKMVIRFHDGLAWLMQITMFVTLGMLVFPSSIPPLAAAGAIFTASLILVARPLGVFICLIPFKLGLRKKALISWVGLRGAVPIILATFPFMAGVPEAATIFNIVFFVVVMSVLIQGTSIPFFSKILELEEPLPKKPAYPIEFERTEAVDADLIDVIVPYNSEVVGKKLCDLKVPKKSLIVLIARGNKFIIPSGTTTIDGGDVLMTLSNEEDFSVLQKIFSEIKE